MERNLRRIVITLTVWAGLAWVGLGQAAASPDRVAAGGNRTDPALEEFLERFDAAQAEIRSLRADFAQTTVNPLFKEPMASRGRFYLRKPDSVLWEYASPEPMKFAIDRGSYTGYFPGRKRAERRDIHRWTEQIFRFFAVGQASEELRRFYEIRLQDPGSDMKGTYLLLLDPTKRRVKKRVERIRFWVDATSFLPVKVEYLNKDGATRTLVFQHVERNPELSASLFRVELPSDVIVTDGFSGLSSSEAPSASAR